MATDQKNIKVVLACDGFGEDLKNTIRDHLKSSNNDAIIQVEDLGCDTYYDAAGKVAKEIKAAAHDQEKTKTVGVLVCGTGMGVGIVANKFPSVRAATCENVSAVRCARAVNDANVLCLGQLVTKPEDAKILVEEFLSQEFISRPVLSDGEPAPWWNGDVEKFLSTSLEGIERVEKDALQSADS